MSFKPFLTVAKSHAFGNRRWGNVFVNCVWTFIWFYQILAIFTTLGVFTKIRIMFLCTLCFHWVFCVLSLIHTLEHKNGSLMSIKFDHQNNILCYLIYFFVYIKPIILYKYCTQKIEYFSCTNYLFMSTICEHGWIPFLTLCLLQFWKHYFLLRRELNFSQRSCYTQSRSSLSEN